jgi:hypothetical protein
LELSKNSLKGLVELYKGGSISEVSQVFWWGDKLREAYYELQKGLFEI